MSNIDKQALLRAAVKIGAERWHSSGDSVITDDYHDGEKVCFDEVAECRRTEGKPLYAELIAAANPTTVLAPLDELEAADKLIDILRQDKDKVIDTSKERISKLLSRVAELEAREVKMPELKMLSDYLREVTLREREDIILGVKLEFHRNLKAAGISAKGDSE